MIILFGPSGAGKSVQGQLLAARYDWRWLSAGQLLRDTKDPDILEQMKDGDLVKAEQVTNVVKQALLKAGSIDRVIMDGFPRQLEQAKWLVDSQPEHGRSICSVIVIEVDKDEIIRRLKLRGRADDSPAAVEEKLEIYQREIHPILDYFRGQDIRIVTIDGNGSVGQVHDRLEAELKACSLV